MGDDFCGYIGLCFYYSLVSTVKLIVVASAVRFNIRRRLVLFYHKPRRIVFLLPLCEVAYRVVYLYVSREFFGGPSLACSSSVVQSNL